MVTIVTDASFEEEVVRASVPALVMFSAPWSGPCNMVRPVFAELARRYGNQIVFREFDLDDNPRIPEIYGIRAVPSFYLFEKGVPQDAVAGAVSFERLEEMILDL